jgi:hypothetical protein
VTRLGKFSPNGRLFCLGSFFCKLQKLAKFLCHFFQSIDYASVMTRNGLGYILGDFLQTHVVTLLETQKLCVDMLRSLTVRGGSFYQKREKKGEIFSSPLCRYRGCTLTLSNCRPPGCCARSVVAQRELFLQLWICIKMK